MIILMARGKPPLILIPSQTDRPLSIGLLSGSPTDDNPFESISSGGWSFSNSTLIDGWSVVPSWPSRVPTAPRSYRHSTPVHFPFEIPENPLRAAAGLETVVEHPLDGTSGEAMMPCSLLDFSRRQVPSIKPRTSALSALVTAQYSSNPFAGVAPASGGPSHIKVYFPHAKQPSGQLLELALPAIATVEDAIALALWTYYEKLWLPKLDESSPRDTDIASWIMLVPGKNGVVNKRIAQSACSVTALFTQLA